MDSSATSSCEIASSRIGSNFSPLGFTSSGFEDIRIEGEYKINVPIQSVDKVYDYLIEKYKDDGFPPTDEELSGLALSTAVSLCSQVSCNLTPQSLSEKTIFSRDTLKFYDALKKTGTRTVGNPLGFTDNKEGVSYINLTSGQRVWEDLRQYLNFRQPYKIQNLWFLRLVLLRIWSKLSYRCNNNPPNSLIPR